ncbi:MAG: hypothetical protein IJ087_01480 [Eggerthellaceae bacterium]|nr:hypothetical protein [Eggerthellaceae bacterium]
MSSGIVLCKRCRFADTDGAGHFMCTDYSPPEANGECWPTAETHVFHEGKASDICASFLFEMCERADRERASGMRVWEIVDVLAECPHCHAENEINPDSLDADELFHGIPFVWDCPECGAGFYVEIDDDDR